MKTLKTFKIKSPIENASNVVLLHGYGADGKNLVGISQYPELQKLNLNWFFLEAPLSPPELSMVGGKAWFNLTLSSFISNMENRNFEAFYETKSQEFENSLQLINNTLWNLNLKGKTFIGGFSQGAMMAANIFFKDSDDLSGLLIFSGVPFQYKTWPTLKETKEVFLTHGKQDPVLPFACGQDFEKKLLGKNTKVTKHWFNGLHEIPMSALEKCSLFIKGNTL